MTTILRRTVQNLQWGIQYGLRFGVAFSILVSVLWALGGAQSVRRDGISYGAVVVGYLVMGVVGGAIFGICRNWSHTRLGAIAIGLVVAFDVFCVASLVVPGVR
jgi:predicted Kef-type K+ transport protein